MAHSAVTCLIETLVWPLRFAEVVFDPGFFGERELDVHTIRFRLWYWYLNPTNPIRVPFQEPETGLIKKLITRFKRELRDALTCYPFQPRSQLTASRILIRAKSNDIREFCMHLFDLLAILKNCWSVGNDQEKLKQLEAHIIEVAYRTEDFVEELLFDKSIDLTFFNFFNYEFNVDHISVIRRTEIATEFRDILDGEYGIWCRLRQTFKEIEVIKGEMKKIHDGSQTVAENEQSGENNSIRDSSKHTPTRKTEIVGRDDDFRIIFDGLIQGVRNELQVIALVGMGGVGKTALARKVFGAPHISYHFHACAWVTVSQVYRVRDLLKGLLQHVTSTTDETYGKNNAQLEEDLYRSLKGKRFLIVMDDVWSTKAWDDVKRCFPEDKAGSRIVLTTRLREVADYVSPKQPPHSLNLLDINQSWELLQWKVFGEESCPPELVDLGMQIARKCNGLPLAIVVVAGFLSQIMRTRDYWKGLADSVSSLVCTDPEQCLEILALSYNYLPNHLKACFLYMGAFPEDCEIEVQKLIGLWTAEGFLDSSLPITNCDPERKAESYLEDLIDRSLVMVGNRSFSGKIKTCRMHDLLRELCLREAKRENFIHVMKRDARGFPVGLINERRLSLHSESWDDFIRSIPFLRSFLCFSIGSGFMPDTLFPLLGFKLLRVLDITFLRFEYFPIQILKLIHLRYLALTATYDIPLSISSLRKLQSLIIQGPWVRRECGESPTLLLEFWNMPWLRHLQVSVACSLTNPFIGQKDLHCPLRPTCLRKLSTIRFASCTFEILSLMPYLKELGLYESKQDYSSDESFVCLSNLVRLNQLEALKCTFYAQKFKARDKLFWRFPPTLRKLTLSRGYVPWEKISHIARLPRLEVLKLKNHAFWGPEWEPAEDGFRSLKQLLIKNNDIAQWKATDIHFPRLQRLALRSCTFLEEIPFGIGEIATLQLVELHNCSESAEISAKEIQEQREGLDVVVKSCRLP